MLILFWLLIYEGWVALLWLLPFVAGVPFATVALVDVLLVLAVPLDLSRSLDWPSLPLAPSA